MVEERGSGLFVGAVIMLFGDTVMASPVGTGTVDIHGAFKV